MKDFYRVAKLSPFFTFEKNDLMSVEDNVINVKRRGHDIQIGKDKLDPAMLSAMVTAGYLEKINTDMYNVGDIIAVRSEHLYSNKSLNKKKWTVSICMVDKVEAKVFIKGTKVMLTVHDIYANRDHQMSVDTDKVIGKTTKYWYINSHNEVATDYFYRSEYDDKIRLVTHNCFIDDESCRAKIRDNENKMNCNIGADLGYIEQKVEEFEKERAKKSKE